MPTDRLFLVYKRTYHLCQWFYQRNNFFVNCNVCYLNFYIRSKPFFYTFFLPFLSCYCCYLFRDYTTTTTWWHWITWKLLTHSPQHTHTPTTVLLIFWNMSGTTWVSRYQKGKTRKVKTNLDLLEQQIVSGSGICWAICKSVPHPRQPRQHPTTQFFYRPDALPAAQPTASKHWRHPNLGKIWCKFLVQETCTSFLYKILDCVSPAVEKCYLVQWPLSWGSVLFVGRVNCGWIFVKFGQ